MSARTFQLTDTTEKEVIRNVFEDIQTVIVSFLPAGVPKAFTRTIINMVEYNSFGGKQIRLQMTMAAFKHFSPNATSDEIYLANVLGWIIEIFQGAACIIDDVVDNGTHRRRKSSWHQLPGVGRNSIIDSHVMVCICESLLKHYFENKTYYVALLNVYNNVKWTSLIGESMESRLTDQIPLEKYTHELYQKICFGRTSCYTFYFPVAAALTMVPGYDLHNVVLEEVAAKLGFFYSVQDDFMAVFGDPLQTGKIGSDIQDRKCSWLIVTALEKADANQKQVLLDNYGQKEESSFQKVRQVFEELGIRTLFRELTDKIGIEFAETLVLLPPTAPTKLYERLFRKLSNRTR